MFVVLQKLSFFGTGNLLNIQNNFFFKKLMLKDDIKFFKCKIPFIVMQNTSLSVCAYFLLKAVLRIRINKFLLSLDSYAMNFYWVWIFKLDPNTVFYNNFL